MTIDYNNYSEVQLIGPMPFINKYFEETFEIWVDGAIKTHSDIYKTRRNNTTITLGDGDSANETLQITYPVQKDFSDLEGALDLLRTSPRLTKLKLWGFLDGRRDHHFSNIIGLYSFASNSKKIIINIEKSIYIIKNDSFEITHEGIFSLFSLSASNKICEVSLDGDVEYKIDNSKNTSVLKPFSAQGLSNTASGKIKLSSKGEPIILFLS